MWSVFFLHKMNAFSIGNASLVKRSLMLKELYRINSENIQSLCCTALSRNADYCLDTAKLIFRSEKIHFKKLSSTDMSSSNTEPLSESLFQKVDNSVAMMSCYDTRTTDGNNKISDSAPIIKSALIFKNKQNSLSSSDVYYRNNLNEKINSAIVWKCSKRRRKVKKKSKLVFLFAGACLSCKRSKDDESFDKIDSASNQEEQADTEINISKTDNAETPLIKSIPENRCIIATIEPQPLEPVLTSGDQEQVDLNDCSYLTCHNVTAGFQNEEKSCQEMDVSKDEEFLFDELPYYGSALEPASEKQRKRKKRKRSCAPGNRYQSKKGKRAIPGEEDEGEIRKRPNYFVGIQVSNPQIHYAVKEVQNHIIKLEPHLKPALINPLTLHVTILVCHISDSLELERACLALEDSYDLLKEEMSKKPLYMSFEGLGHFQNKVLFAELKREETVQRLTNLSNHVKKCFEEHGLNLSGNKSLIPHLTLAKLSKGQKRRKKGINKIEPSLYEEHKDVKFGIQLAKGLQLLSMLKKKDEKGYYHCEKELFFNAPDTQRSHTTELNSALQKEKEAIRQRISHLVHHQLTNSTERSIMAENVNKGPCDSANGKE